MFQKNGFLLVILMVIAIYTSLAKANNNLSITVINAINFGRILYTDKLGIYTINNNSLQTLNGVNIQNSNAKLGTIILQGIPNKTVELSFSGGALQGFGGNITLTGTSVYNNSNRVILDNKGYAKILVNSVLNVSQMNLNGEFKGNITIWAHYDNNTQIAQQDILAIAELISVKDTKISDLLFGAIYPKKTGNCTVTLSTNNTMTHNCIRVEGNYSANIFTVNTLVALPINLIVIPTSATLTGPGGAKLTANNFKKAVQVTALNTYKVTIGATLTIPSNAVPGVYNGQYNVTILL